MKFSYCHSLTEYRRFITREVKVGDLGIGANNPIRLQSMTTTDTMDTVKTVEQSIRMIEAGCELVRITAPSMNEARNLENIKKELRKRGFNTPLVADIHFTPNAAEAAARIVEKVRVNPGNYADKKKFETIDYTDSAYQEELDRIRERFTPLIKICREYGTAMRIGTNHGSLSDRIMSRYGDSPLGMVESAMEFVRICEENNFHQIVLSMKSSNPKVMVEAYRLLVNHMMQSDRNYPLHLGVTEAGDGEDGRIKSAAGIGTLLEDGLGDTVRVSLTEDPEFELPVAKRLVDRYLKRLPHHPIEPISFNLNDIGFSPFDFKKRQTIAINNFGGLETGHSIPRVIADFSSVEKITPASLFSVGYNYSPSLDKWNLQEQACDYIYTDHQTISFDIPGTLGIICRAKVWNSSLIRHYPYFSLAEFLGSTQKSDTMNFVEISLKDVLGKNLNPGNFQSVVFVIATENKHGMAEQRRLLFELIHQNFQHPVILKRTYSGLNPEEFQLHSATDAGALLIDGMGDGLWFVTDGLERPMINSVAFGILQATRTRISKTEYISCPSCGRTLFDLQETTAKIRARTAHLKGLKIGIMGCIVNGPGEMADADYGYVGSGPGKITLYKGKEVVMRNIESSDSVDKLIGLIREHGDWIDSPT